ncbi:hypothetical protein Goshw_024956 [Gossypium schwendimanii]|uniref:Uncharacterized protein n=1 Tax=Gossypium schwendimanii TaxID=34291 RepID=A0A7J9N7R0_GOSSC|nr:hypothetical protein [Gossypium schwendimanii]
MKLTKSVVGSESPWMFENHFVENGHGIKDCTQKIPARKSKISVDPPYTLALKAESKLAGKKENMELMGGEEMIKEQGCIYGIEKVEKLNDSTVQECKNANLEKKTSWKKIKPVATVIQTKAENSTRKRKSPEKDLARSEKKDIDVDGTEKLKQDDFEGCEKAFSKVMLDSSEQLDIKNFLRSAAAKRQAD